MSRAETTAMLSKLVEEEVEESDRFLGERGQFRP